jgi:hypothetical protein
LFRVLAPALRRHVGDGPFEDLQERLLHAFARDIAGDRNVLCGPSVLVILAVVYLARLCFL